MSLADTRRFAVAAAEQRRVLLAVMLRNMRTRFFGHGLGYLVAIAWPVVHILILIALFAGLGRAPPVGDSALLFIATGSVPFQIFSYVSRFMMMSLLATRPLLSFPQIKVLDVLFASAILEALSSVCVAIVLIGLAWILEIEAMPRDVVQAACAFGASVLLGLGFGLFNGIIVLAWPQWFTVYSLSMIVFWITSGVYLLPDSMPEPLRSAAAYHPLQQVIEWMRSAFYGGVGETFLDRAYVIEFGLGATFLGLVTERLTRGALLASR